MTVVRLRGPLKKLAGERSRHPIEYATRDRRSSRMLAAVISPFYGPKIWYADDPSGEWEQASGVELPEGGDVALELYFGTTTGEVFGSADAGAGWFTVATHLPPVYSATAAR